MISMNKEIKNDTKLVKIFSIILTKYCDYMFTVEELIELSGFSRSTVVKVIMLNFRMMPKKMIESLKIYTAINKLFEGKRLSSFYCDVGFSEARILSNAIKKRIGILPNEIFHNAHILTKDEIFKKIWMFSDTQKKVNKLLKLEEIMSIEKAKVKLSESAIIIEEEKVIVNSESELIHELNDIGYYIISILKEIDSLPMIASKIAKKYDIAYEDAMVDLKVFIEDLITKELITIEEY